VVAVLSFITTAFITANLLARLAGS